MYRRQSDGLIRGAIQEWLYLTNSKADSGASCMKRRQAGGPLVLRILRRCSTLIRGEASWAFF
eukprot:scaffold1135_cov216-Pinguiococcus_pyrenoidosus.AAC.4